jgi:hypothetical protein
MDAWGRTVETTVVVERSAWSVFALRDAKTVRAVSETGATTITPRRVHGTQLAADAAEGGAFGPTRGARARA